jgi:hypothetical protein
MAEYIEREAAVKAANEWVSEACMASVMRVSRLFDKLQKVPAADVAPVVYCRECKRSGLTEFGKRYCSEPMGAFEGCIPVEDDSFCSGGKRREDAHAQD